MDCKRAWSGKRGWRASEGFLYVYLDGRRLNSRDVNMYDELQIIDGVFKFVIQYGRKKGCECTRFMADSSLSAQVQPSEPMDLGLQ